LNAEALSELEAQQAERACAEALSQVQQLAAEAAVEREAQLEEHRAISAALADQHHF